MTDYTSVKSGPPDGGFFSKNDRYTDVDGFVYLCVKGGQASASPFPMSSRAEFRVLEPAQNLGTKNSATVSVLEAGDGCLHQTVFTFTALPLTISNSVAANQASGLKIYDYPRGRINVIGCTLSVTETTTSTIASTLIAAAVAKIAMGSTIGTNASMATTEVDHAPATTIPVSSTINVAAATPGRAQLAASAQFDGTTNVGSQKSVFLNFAVPTDTDLLGDATITLTGTARLTWMFLGDV